MYYIEGGHLAHRTGGKWSAPSFETSLTADRATSSDGNRTLFLITSQLQSEIKRNDWRDRWIQHVTDEPTADNAADYRILVGMVRKYMPEYPILDATMDPDLPGSVDIWCPQVQEYQKHRDRFEACRAVGDRIWYYTCCCPGGPWLNRLLDMELLRPALFGWAAAMFNLDGFLHWGLNHYREDQDPFKMSVIPNWGGGSNSLPAGDTHIVYPGEGQPWSSLRLEAQREGFEDYELLKLLKRKDQRTADRIIRSNITGFDAYTKNTAVFRTNRNTMYRAMSRQRKKRTDFMDPVKPGQVRDNS
jgi:hypothetical protein